MKTRDWTNPGKDELLFVPLGGCGEIGMNLNLYGHNGSWLMVDCGVLFPGMKLPGVEVVTPNIEFALELGDRLAGLVLTHGHEDHLGAVPYLAEWLKCPIYATSFTYHLLRAKLREDGVEVADLREISQGARFSCGAFGVEFVNLTHSIPEPNALLLETPLGAVFHTGDWKLDESPLLGEDYDVARLQSLGDSGILAMVCDSTNAMIAGRSGSEREARDGLIEMIAAEEGRIAVGCFASNVARLDSIVRAATKAGRRVALLGRSMQRVTNAARDSGYLQGWPKIYDARALMSAPRDEVLYLCTGSQGESRAALLRLAEGRHPMGRLESGDTVIFSSRVIPGNENEVYALQNRFVRGGIRVRTGEESRIHVSGHPCRDELACLYEWVRPGCSVPVHGEARQQAAHADLARGLGVPHGVVPENGDVVRLAEGAPCCVGKVPSGRWAVEGLRLIDDGSSLYRERRKLGRGGIVYGCVVLDSRGRLLRRPRLWSCGVFSGESEGEDEARFGEHFEHLVEVMVERGGRGAGDMGEELRRKLGDWCKGDLGRVPRINVMVMGDE
ncbi:MAG: ribonuclease J [Alphaproteobacteria bacterium]|nr:ribonuclease J [Alphaproteobacteria bacterium]MDA7983734.1 ribonuclease J [Alphaproteobacteria bacterium]MDA7989269.1 ribonuclease J [Alphaproteobacteria bacterium]MDA8009961.1 ribonuclease J [Alphaproteobacteria bacterium]